MSLGFLCVNMQPSILDILSAGMPKYMLAEFPADVSAWQPAFKIAGKHEITGDHIAEGRGR